MTYKEGRKINSSHVRDQLLLEKERKEAYTNKDVKASDLLVKLDHLSSIWEHKDFINRMHLSIFRLRESVG